MVFFSWETHTMNMKFNDTHIFHIPKSFWDVSQLRSTLGHKVNHSFKFYKTTFDFCFHPRMGNIRCIIATSKHNKRGRNINPLWIHSRENCSKMVL